MEQLADAHPALIAIVGGVALFALLVGFGGLRRYRLIEDVPTARIRSAHQGYVELVGRAVMMEGVPVVAPLSQLQCCWFRYRVEERDGKNWRTVQSGTSDALFVLRDDTGECVIDPDGAEVDSVHSRSWFDGQRRMTESRLMDNDPLYAIGWFETVGGGERADSLQHATAEVLREWKQRPQTLAERFDHDRNGTIDAEEWEDARRVARAQAERELRHTPAPVARNVMHKPPRGGHFLLANRDQAVLVRRLKWRAAIGLMVFVGAGTGVLLMLLARMGT